MLQRWLDRILNLLEVQRNLSVELISTNFTLRDLIELKMIIETLIEQKDQYNRGYEDGVKATQVSASLTFEDILDEIKAEIDRKTEIHTDGELWIRNIDTKRIINSKTESEGQYASTIPTCKAGLYIQTHEEGRGREPDRR